MTKQSLPEIESTYQQLKEADPRRAAEYAYALAMTNMHKGEVKKARQFGHECLAILSQVRTETFDDCTPLETFIGDVSIPDIFHEGVVKDRLQAVL